MLLCQISYIQGKVKRLKWFEPLQRPQPSGMLAPGAKKT